MTKRIARAGATVALALAAPLLLGACSDDGDETKDGEASSTTTTTAGAASSGSSSTTATTAAGGPVNAAATVEAEEFSFTPAAVEVAVGDAVTFLNTGSANHTVTPDVEAGVPEPWVSQRIAPEETFVVTISSPGTYAYFCSIHPERMQGSITVVE